jgi:hypothetical protein
MARSPPLLPGEAEPGVLIEPYTIKRQDENPAPVRFWFG